MAPGADDASLRDILRALDPSLSLLASQAAIELDIVIRGEEVSLESTKRLAQLLSQSFERLTDTPSRPSLVDPTTASLMTRVFEASRWSTKVRTVDDLINEALRVASVLHSTGTLDQTMSLQEIRAFCAALSECAASYVESIHERPTHPFRRLR